MELELNPSATSKDARRVANRLTITVAYRNRAAAVNYYNKVLAAINRGAFDDIDDRSFETLLEAVEYAEEALAGLGDKQSRRERKAARRAYRETRRQLRRQRKAGEISRTEQRRLRKEARALKKERYKEAKAGRKDRRDRRKSGISQTIDEVGPGGDDSSTYIAPPTPIYLNPFVIGGVLLVIGTGVVLLMPRGK